MTNDPRKAHLISFGKLTPAERLNWALRTGWSNYLALPEDKRIIFDKLRNNGKHRNKSELG